MGIYGQPNSWQCGPFALKHALLLFGELAHEDALAPMAGSSEEAGTDERGLARAAVPWGFDLGVVRRRSARTARRALDRWLARGHPVLLCVDEWDHWITVADVESDRYVIFDSHYDTVLRVETWPALAPRIAFHERRWHGLLTRSLYDLHPLVPRTARPRRIRLTPDAAVELGRDRHRGVRLNFDAYVRAALASEMGTDASEPPRALATFLLAQRDRIVTRARQCDAAPDAALAGALDDLRLAAHLVAARLPAAPDDVLVERYAGAVRSLSGRVRAERPAA